MLTVTSINVLLVISTNLCFKSRPWETGWRFDLLILSDTDWFLIRELSIWMWVTDSWRFLMDKDIQRKTNILIIDVCFWRNMELGRWCVWLWEVVGPPRLWNSLWCLSGAGFVSVGGRSFEWGRHKGSLLIMITILIMVLILKRLKWLIFSGVISPSLDFQPNPILTHPPTRHFVAHREGSLSAGVLKVWAARLEWESYTTGKRHCIRNTIATNLSW